MTKNLKDAKGKDLDINILSRGDNKKANKINNREKRNEETKQKRNVQQRSEIVPKGKVLNRRNVCPEKNSSKREKSLFLKERC